MPYWPGWTFSDAIKQRIGEWVDTPPIGHLITFPDEDEVIRWYWRDEISLASRGEDFQDAVRVAAQKYVESLSDFFSE